MDHHSLADCEDWLLYRWLTDDLTTPQQWLDFFLKKHIIIEADYSYMESEVVYVQT